VQQTQADARALYSSGIPTEGSGHCWRGHRVLQRVHRLVYWNAFVANDDEALIDMTIPSFAPTMQALSAERGDGSVVLAFRV
jgi:hypothetical protein